MPKPTIKDMPDILGDIASAALNPKNHKVLVIDFVIQEYDCTVVRTDMGHWVGYVIVPKKHPLYKKDKYDLDVQVHGGLTFDDTLHWIESKNKGKFAYGFDFMHGFDDGGSKEEAKSECVKLVIFLKEHER